MSVTTDEFTTFTAADLAVGNKVSIITEDREVVGTVHQQFTDEDGTLAAVEVRTSVRAGRPTIVSTDDVVDVEVLPADTVFVTVTDRDARGTLAAAGK